MSKMYKLPLETLVDLRDRGFHFSEKHRRAFTAIAKLDLSCSTLGDVLLALRAHNATLDMQGADEMCRLGARQALHDTLALIAARPAQTKADMAEKIFHAEFVATPHLFWMMQASVRCDAALIMPDWSREQIENWIANRRRQAQS